MTKTKEAAGQGWSNKEPTRRTPGTRGSFECTWSALTGPDPAFHVLQIEENHSAVEGGGHPTGLARKASLARFAIGTGPSYYGRARTVTVADIQTLFEQRNQAWARRDPVALASGYADDAVVSSPMFAHAEGRTAIQQSFTALFHVFPDWQISLEEPCVTGDRGMQVCKVRATQQGDFMGIAGSGKRVEFDCVLIYDFENGRISRERRIYDFTGMLIQLGVLRSKPAV